MRAVLPIVFIFLGLDISAQHYCATVERTQAALNIDSAYQQSMDVEISRLENFEAGLILESTRDVKEVTLPVVVHVLYQSDEQNISVDQIQSQIDVLNRDFGWRQSDRIKIPKVWRDLGRDSGIRFKLADVDPDGNFTTGITRKKVIESEIGKGDNYYQARFGGVDPWSRPHYINIWVCEIGDNVLGYTFLPSTSAPANDGIVIDPRAFGTTGIAVEPYNGGRTMVHEMGHYLGLRHLWGMEEGSCTNTDYMNDTPWQQEPNFGCAKFPSVSCASEPDGDMFMNFMDYGDDTCAFLFTKRQIDFMQLVLRTSRVGLIHSQAITRIEDAPEIKQVIYPNPVSDRLHIGGLDARSRVYEIHNQTGELLHSGVIQSADNSINMQPYVDGVYFVNIEGVAHKVVKLTR